jgi:hypothetical protein
LRNRRADTAASSDARQSIELAGEEESVAAASVVTIPDLTRGIARIEWGKMQLCIQIISSVLSNLTRGQRSGKIEDVGKNTTHHAIHEPYRVDSQLRAAHHTAIAAPQREAWVFVPAKTYPVMRSQRHPDLLIIDSRLEVSDSHDVLPTVRSEDTELA